MSTVEKLNDYSKKRKIKTFSLTQSNDSVSSGLSAIVIRRLPGKNGNSKIINCYIF